MQMLRCVQTLPRYLHDWAQETCSQQKYPASSGDRCAGDIQSFNSFVSDALRLLITPFADSQLADVGHLRFCRPEKEYLYIA